MTAVCNQTLRHHHASGQLCSLPCAGSSVCSFSIVIWFCFTWLSVPNFSAVNLAKRNCGERDNPRTAMRIGGEQKNPERTELRMRSTVAYTVFPVLCTFLLHVVELEAGCSWRLEKHPVQIEFSRRLHLRASSRTDPGICNQIATATEEQSSVSAGITDNTAQISLIAAQMSEDADQRLDRSQKLRELSDNMHNLVKRFKI